MYRRVAAALPRVRAPGSVCKRAGPFVQLPVVVKQDPCIAFSLNLQLFRGMDPRRTGRPGTPIQMHHGPGFDPWQCGEKQHHLEGKGRRFLSAMPGRIRVGLCLEEEGFWAQRALRGPHADASKASPRQRQPNGGLGGLGTEGYLARMAMMVAVPRRLIN